MGEEEKRREEDYDDDEDDDEDEEVESSESSSEESEDKESDNKISEEEKDISGDEPRDETSKEANDVKETKESYNSEDSDSKPEEKALGGVELDKKPEPSGSDTVEIKKETLWKYSTFVLLAIVIIGAYYVFNGGDITGDVVADTQPQPSAGAGQPSGPSGGQPATAKVPVTVDDDSVLGDKDAPVTIIEFSDYECTFCKKYFDQTYSQIKKEYVDTGKVKIVFRDFPLSFHRQAQKAGEAAECAGEQGKYYEMHDKLFTDGVNGGIDSYKNYAQELGLDQGEFNKCLDSGEMAAEIQKDFQEGQRFGVRGTPAFFINGRLISGAQPFGAFQQAIEAEL